MPTMTHITALDALLGEFPETSPTVKVVRGVLGASAWGPGLPGATSLAELAHQPWVPRDPEVVARATELSQAEHIAEVLRIGRAIDTGDDLVDVRTGFHTAVEIYHAVKAGQSPMAPVRERQQQDAVFKLLGVADLTCRLFEEGQSLDRVRALLTLESGVALVSWLGAVEVALPFLLLSNDPTVAVLEPMVQRFRTGEERRLSGLVGEEAVADAAFVAGDLVGLVDGVANANRDRLHVVAQVAGGVLGRLSGPISGVRGVLASGVDALPVYRLLVARLVAEHCLRIAVGELRPDAALPQAPFDLVAMLHAPSRTLLDELGAPGAEPVGAHQVAPMADVTQPFALSDPSRGLRAAPPQPPARGADPPTEPIRRGGQAVDTAAPGSDDRGAASAHRDAGDVLARDDAHAEWQADETQARAQAERQAAEAQAQAQAERQAAEAQARAQAERQAAEAQARAQAERQAAEAQARAEERATEERAFAARAAADRAAASRPPSSPPVPPVRPSVPRAPATAVHVTRSAESESASHAPVARASGAPSTGTRKGCLGGAVCWSSCSSCSAAQPPSPVVPRCTGPSNRVWSSCHSSSSGAAPTTSQFQAADGAEAVVAQCHQSQSSGAPGSMGWRPAAPVCSGCQNETAGSPMCQHSSTSRPRSRAGKSTSGGSIPLISTPCSESSSRSACARSRACVADRAVAVRSSLSACRCGARSASRRARWRWARSCSSSMRRAMSGSAALASTGVK